jgi:hypothetical protein
LANFFIITHFSNEKPKILTQRLPKLDKNCKAYSITMKKN